MWIKALDRSMWVNMKHVTHFSVQTEAVVRGSVMTSGYVAYAYINASSVRSNYTLNNILRGDRCPEETSVSDQTRILVCQGSAEECEQFVADKTFLEEAFQWVGYLVAGGIGAILTLIFQNLRPDHRMPFNEGIIGHSRKDFLDSVVNLTESCCLWGVTLHPSSGDVGLVQSNLILFLFSSFAQNPTKIPKKRGFFHEKYNNPVIFWGFCEKMPRKTEYNNSKTKKLNMLNWQIPKGNCSGLLNLSLVFFYFKYYTIIVFFVVNHLYLYATR